MTYKIHGYGIRLREYLLRGSDEEGLINLL